MAMSDDGTVVTASDCKITNNSYGAVRVRSVSISAAAGWNLTAFGDKSSLAGEKVDSNKLGFAMSIGGGAQVATASNEATQSLIIAPIDGCYMTGVGDSTRNSVSVAYSAIVTPLSSVVENANVANVVFVIEWDNIADVTEWDTYQTGAAQAAPNSLKSPMVWSQVGDEKGI